MFQYYLLKKILSCQQITAPQELTVLMSALRQGEPVSQGNKKVHAFRQPVLIPSYLYVPNITINFSLCKILTTIGLYTFNRLAIVAGDLQSRQIGPRSHVWAEPTMLDRAAYEFAEVIFLNNNKKNYKYIFFFCKF